MKLCEIKNINETVNKDILDKVISDLEKIGFTIRDNNQFGFITELPLRDNSHALNDAPNMFFYDHINKTIIEPTDDNFKNFLELVKASYERDARWKEANNILTASGVFEHGEVNNLYNTNNDYLTFYAPSKEDLYEKFSRYYPKTPSLVVSEGIIKLRFKALFKK